MHKAKVFKTSDGNLFEDEAEAASHEATIKICDWAKRHNIRAIDTITWGHVVQAMIEDASELAHVFSSVSQSLPSYRGPSNSNEISPKDCVRSDN